ncbi:hypothetical protein K9U39_18725 [Rhodoblastus acidophilus]|uniref:Uncharacterized protein n=1 Tax=Candidatus Rhodoblastus alkanivorans TaxID=2954117 RepID=A0ABS9Z5H5_9HYPH|nr:hypothetical protein [Candidatus Rhodoblastus alkanivorans]MCI4677533.1 hypothetical protein [Candidatus Rhodoblastus alkanivorans]MCI4681892.1 hypothetical protein [Candidatus Rhodoblastus alkanivorans]MDI4642942.1 hypothetical protein [Rhodoblastus acidophilus]
MRRTSLFILALASGALVSASAEAASKHKSRQPTSRVQTDAHAAELTVTKRSFLDPGNVVPVDSQDRYAGNIKHPSPAPGGTYRNDSFGDWLLPGNFGVPGFYQR